jgi:hypothetical protein
VDSYSENEIFNYSLDSALIALDINSILHHLGYDRTSVPEFANEIIQEILHCIPSLVSPQCTISIFDEKNVSFDKISMTCMQDTFLTQPIITKRLRSASTVAFFVCTIGKQFEEWSKHEIDSGDLLKGYIIDHIASEVVERIADQMELRLDEIIIKRGWERTNRYSPGYCDWSVSEQHKLFSYFPLNPCGVTLTESALMIPIKSVSGVIGLGPNAIRRDYECSLCKLENCFMRRIPNAKGSRKI